MWRDIVIYTPMYVTFFWTVVLLLTSKQKNQAKHFLGIFMLTAFVLYLSHAVYFNKYLGVYLYFEPIYMLTSLSVYPLYFWYIKLLTVETKTDLTNLRMFIPAVVISSMMAVISFFMSPEERAIFTNQHLQSPDLFNGDSFLIVLQNWVNLAGRMIFAAQIFFFLIYGSRLVVRYNNRIANFYSNLENKTIVWVKLLLISFVVTSIMSVVFNIIGKVVFVDNLLLLLIPSSIFSVLLFTIGLQGFMQNYTVLDLEMDEQQHQRSELKKFNTTVLKENLLYLFESEFLYKQPDLKITHISAALQTNRTYISNLINNEFSCTFSEFVNQYRLVEAKRLLLEESTKMYSLDYVSEKSGFGSLSTFIRVFKETEGITPGRFRDIHILDATKKDK